MRLSGCVGKIAYASRALAEKAKRGFLTRDKKNRDPLHAYHCNGCGEFHLGRSIRDGRRKRVGSKDDLVAKRNRLGDLLAGKP